MKALLALRSATSVDDSQPADPDFERLLEQVAERLQEGVPVDLEELAARHPQYADRLGELLPAIEMLMRMGEAPVEQAAAGNEELPAIPPSAMGLSLVCSQTIDQGHQTEYDPSVLRRVRSIEQRRQSCF